MGSREVAVYQMKIVDRCEHRNAFAPQRVQQVDEFRLPANIEVLRRLVQQQKLRLLRQAKSDLDPLTLSPAQFVEDSAAQAGGIGQLSARSTARRSSRAGPLSSPR